MFYWATNFRHPSLPWQNVKGDSIEFRQRKTKELGICTCRQWPNKFLPSHQITKFCPLRTQGFWIIEQEPNQRSAKGMGKDAGIDKRVSFHTGKAYLCHLGLDSGLDFYAVSKLLGHKTIQANQIYAKIIDEKKKAAMELLPMIE